MQLMLFPKVEEQGLLGQEAAVTECTGKQASFLRIRIVGSQRSKTWWSKGNRQLAGPQLSHVHANKSAHKLRHPENEQKIFTQVVQEGMAFVKQGQPMHISAELLSPGGGTRAHEDPIPKDARRDAQISLTSGETKNSCSN